MTRRDALVWFTATIAALLIGVYAGSTDSAPTPPPAPYSTPLYLDPHAF